MVFFSDCRISKSFYHLNSRRTSLRKLYCLRPQGDKASHAIVLQSLSASMLCPMALLSLAPLHRSYARVCVRVYVINPS